MKFKDTGTIWITTETGNRFAYHFCFDKDGKVVGGHFVGSRGDIFPLSDSDIELANNNIYGDDEVTIEMVQPFFRTRVVAVKTE